MYVFMDVPVYRYIYANVHVKARGSLSPYILRRGFSKPHTYAESTLPSELSPPPYFFF